MKIIHTADWHLGHRLYNYDRTDEEEHFFRQLAATVRKEQPDALVVSGDIFHSGTPGNDVAKRFTERLLDVQAECPAMETVVIAGNHDSYSRLVVDKALWKRCRAHLFGMPAEDKEGRAEFVRNVVEIPGKGLIAAVPFCHSRNFPLVEGSEGDNRAKNYFDGLARYVRSRAGGLPAVLMAHLAVSGDIDLRGHDKSFMVGGEECVDVADLGAAYDYVALGHIHCPQWIKSARKVARYSGSPRAIHFDETYDHGVDIVTVEAGREPEVRTEVFEPLHALVTLCGEEGRPFEEALAEVASASLPPDTYVRINVRLGADESAGPDWSERSRKACLANGLRFCLNNPVRAEVPEGDDSKRPLTMAELKELSDDEVLQILSKKHKLSERQCELIKSLM
ncbi:MAG: exonuclease SbcCD subunit D [Kiritimatiellae bacterium]|nr:exonuclease SbcCD subunit D [Kiritimatiellia bacterium]